MRSLIRFELKKLLYDRQLRFIALFIVSYLIYMLLFVPVNESNFNSWCVYATMDSVFMVMFIGLVAANIFTSDYKYRTYKNFIPYVEFWGDFSAKIITNIIGVLMLLLLWYAVGIILAVLKAGYFDLSVFPPLGFRFITQYFLILFHSGFLVLAGTVTRNSAVTNVFTILAWIGYAFIPISGEYLYDRITFSYEWGKIPDMGICLTFAAFYGVSCVLGGVIANRREVLI